MTALISAAALVAAVLVTACRVLTFKRLLGYATPVDICFSLSVFAVFGGTFAGLMIATLSGLIMAVGLTVCRRLMGYERLVVRKTSYRFYPLVMWCKWPPSHVWSWPDIKTPHVEWT